MGTPEFALEPLQRLIDTEDLKVVGVITQPDRPVGRKQVMTPPPVKVLADKFAIEVMQPERISSDEETIRWIEEKEADVLVTAAYGQILKPNILDLCSYGVVNLHASMLPQYRGPAPINWMVINGDKDVGICTMQTDAGVDTGDILLGYYTNLGRPNETAPDLAYKPSIAGADLLVHTLQNYKDITPLKQSDLLEQNQDLNNPEKLLAPFMDKKLGEIDFEREEFILGSANPKQSDFKVVKKNTAQNLHNLVRGLLFWPGTYFMQGDQKVSILETRVVELESSSGVGTINKIDTERETFVIETREAGLEMLRLKPQGKNEMSALAWLNGQRLAVGDKL